MLHQEWNEMTLASYLIRAVEEKIQFMIILEVSIIRGNGPLASPLGSTQERAEWQFSVPSYTTAVVIRKNKKVTQHSTA